MSFELLGHLHGEIEGLPSHVQSTFYLVWMKPDARITDIIENLADAEEYVRGVVGSFIQHGFDKQRSLMTIGVSGAGIYPNYFIQEPSETAPGRRRIVFNGQSHREILEDSFWGEGWSSEAMSFAEVQTLLSDLRQFKKKRLGARGAVGRGHAPAHFPARHPDPLGRLALARQTPAYRPNKFIILGKKVAALGAEHGGASP